MRTTGTVIVCAAHLAEDIAGVSTGTSGKVHSMKPPGRVSVQTGTHCPAPPSYGNRAASEKTVPQLEACHAAVRDRVTVNTVFPSSLSVRVSQGFLATFLCPQEHGTSYCTGKHGAGDRRRLGKQSRRTSQRDAARMAMANATDGLGHLDHYLDRLLNDNPERMMTSGTVSTRATLLAGQISAVSTPCPLFVRVSQGILEPFFSPQRHGIRRWAGNQGTGDRGLYKWPIHTGQSSAVPLEMANPAFTLDDHDRGGRGDNLPRHHRRVTLRIFSFFKITRKGVSHVCTNQSPAEDQEGHRP